jgi:hypothetical protein
MITTLHKVTITSLLNKDVKVFEIASIIDATEQHVRDLCDGRVSPTSRELAIFRLIANVPRVRLRNILDALEEGSEWRRIPGYSRYEASVDGHIRRAVAGHGSMPGHVLRPKQSESGHYLVNVSSDSGKIRSVGVHALVCMAFHGLPPSKNHMACHRDDVKSDNSKGNLYWGPAMQNARDRSRNAYSTKSGTPLTQGPFSYGPPTLKQLRDFNKKSMAYRLKLLVEK